MFDEIFLGFLSFVNTYSPCTGARTCRIASGVITTDDGIALANMVSGRSSRAWGLCYGRVDAGAAVVGFVLGVGLTDSE